MTNFITFEQMAGFYPISQQTFDKFEPITREKLILFSDIPFIKVVPPDPNAQPNPDAEIPMALTQSQQYAIARLMYMDVSDDSVTGC